MLIVIISWFAFAPHPPGLAFESADKVQHVLAFGTLAFTALLAQRPGRREAATAAVGLLLYGGFIEIVQTFLPTRSGEWADWLADAVGIVAGLAVCALSRRICKPALA